MRSPRRILLLVTDLEIGGTPTVVRELAVRLRDPGHVHVEVACLGPRGPVADQLDAAGVRVTALGARGSHHLPLVVHRLDHLIGSRLIDTCLSFLIHANAVAAVSKLFLRDVRHFQSIQTTQPNPRWHWVVQRVVHHAAERVIVPSPSVAAVAQAWSGIPAEKLAVIPNAVEAGGGEAAPARPAGAPFSVGFIGRLDPIKRVPDLVAAVGQTGPDVHLHVFGEGLGRRAIETEVARRNLGSRVTLHGAISSPQEALARMDVLVLPSQAEGFGLVLIEAMAAGVPVVATDVPGIRDVVRDGRTGLLVPPGRPDRIAAAIRQLRQDPRLRDALVAAGREDVRQRFGWGPVLQQYRQVLGLYGE